ncbi:MAG: cytochrome-c oxidase, cbb3-type subunit I, partial [Gammaproteobacteria bacterium]|nr:cytochrome-c oxidase, cbb3-type subunit I [Gammaproteobacteria bacterium]
MSATIVLAGTSFLALVAALFAQDTAFRMHSVVLLLTLGIATIVMARRIDFSGAAAKPDTSGYMDGPVRAGVILTMFWGVVGFL